MLKHFVSLPFRIQCEGRSRTQAHTTRVSSDSSSRPALLISKNNSLCTFVLSTARPPANSTYPARELLISSQYRFFETRIIFGICPLDPPSKLRLEQCLTKRPSTKHPRAGFRDHCLFFKSPSRFTILELKELVIAGKLRCPIIWKI